jgi:hypothetical protein
MRKTFSFTGKLKPDQEVTIYVFLPKLNEEYYKGKKGQKGYEGIGPCHNGSGHSIKLRGALYNKKDGEKTARCYIFHYEYEGGDCNNFQKEYPHPRYSKFQLNKEEEKDFPESIGKVMGFKAALLNSNDGKNVEFWSCLTRQLKL